MTEPACKRSKSEDVYDGDRKTCSEDTHVVTGEDCKSLPTLVCYPVPSDALRHYAVVEEQMDPYGYDDPVFIELSKKPQQDYYVVTELFDNDFTPEYFLRIYPIDAPTSGVLRTIPQFRRFVKN